MKIRDLNINDYVIVYDLGKSEYSEGMTVVGRVLARSLDYACIKTATDDIYIISYNNYFDLWSNFIESKTESVSTPNPGKIYSYSNSTVGPNEEIISHSQSNDVQQRKRNKKIVQWSDDTKLKFIERAIQDLSPLAAYHIGNAIDVLAVAESKEDIEQARWSLERAFENWEQ